MYRFILRRTLHDRKLPSVVIHRARPVFVKCSEKAHVKQIIRNKRNPEKKLVKLPI